MANIKKFLDSDGLTILCRKFQDYPDNEILGTVINAIDNIKVDKENGKGLSSNDFTTEEKEKLARLQETVQINIDNALSSTSENPVQNKVINSAIEARVNKAGDTMTGNLTISKSSVPKISLKDNSGSKEMVFYCNNGISGIESRDSSSYPARGLYLNTPSQEATLDNALQFVNISDSGLYKYYKVFHAGMETPIPIANGGTGATNATNALANLGAVKKSGDTMSGKLVANATSVATLGTAQVRNIWAGTANISEVENSLNEGDIYLQYEEG